MLCALVRVVMNIVHHTPDDGDGRWLLYKPVNNLSAGFAFRRLTKIMSAGIVHNLGRDFLSWCSMSNLSPPSPGASPDARDRPWW